MSNLKHSNNYIWTTAGALGKGATATVFQGVHKKTGESVAVKTFNYLSHMRPVEVQMREFEVIQKLDHKNIVKMLAIEEEADSRKKVLVMELCFGGSLHSILDDPENSYGLEQEEFLCVLRDVSAGMKYLRDNSIIHRDLKPGNIIKFISEDKRSIYKLTDFGAARELEDGQEFASLYGTEEYLYPDMYERAVLKNHTDKTFTAIVDLWSIGVTLYHVATGSLPFRPFAGRKDHETMHYITTKKASGVISAVQHSEKGPIEWSRELPKTCLLNQELRDLVTALLVGIVECDFKKMWTFDKFFESATDIVTRKVFHVFYMNDGKEISVYMQPHKTLQDLKEQIATQVKIPSSKQLLLFDKCVFDATPSAKVTTLPNTSHSQPFVLVHTDRNKVDSNRSAALSACFPMFCKTSTSSVNLDHDASLAKTCCSVAYAVKRLVVKMVQCRDLLLGTPEILMSDTRTRVTKLGSDADLIGQRMDDIHPRSDQLENYFSMMSHILSASSDWENKVENFSHFIKTKNFLKDEVDQKLLSLQADVKTLKQKVLVSMHMENEWKLALTECVDLEGCVELADTYVNKIRESWQCLVRNKAVRALSGHDQQFHILEKVKIQATSKKLLALLQEKCLKACLQASAKLDEWFSILRATMVQCKCLEEDMMSINTYMSNFITILKETESEASELSQDVTSCLSKLSISETGKADLPPSLNVPFEKKEATKVSLKKLKLKLDRLNSEHINILEIAEENNAIMQKFCMFVKEVQYAKGDADNEQ